MLQPQGCSLAGLRPEGRAQVGASSGFEKSTVARPRKWQPGPFREIRRPTPGDETSLARQSADPVADTASRRR